MQNLVKKKANTQKWSKSEVIDADTERVLYQSVQIKKYTKLSKKFKQIGNSRQNKVQRTWKKGAIDCEVDTDGKSYK